MPTRVPFKPVQPPSSDYIPISKDIAQFMVGKGSAKVITYSKLRWVNKAGVRVKEQEIDESQDLDRLALFSRRFGDVLPGDEENPATLHLASEYADGKNEYLEYDSDLDVFFKPNETGRGNFYGIPYFVQPPEDYKPTDASGVAQTWFIPVDGNEWGLRTPEAGEVLSKLRKKDDWKKVKKFDVINTNIGANENTIPDGSDGIYIWNGAKLLQLGDPEDKSQSAGVNPLSIRAIIDVPIGYYDNALRNDASVDWFSMKSVLPRITGDSEAAGRARDALIEPNRNTILVPGCIGDDQGGLLQVYSFIFKNQKFRVVAYTSAQVDPVDLQDDFLNYMDYKTQYQSKPMFLRRLNDLVGSSRGVNNPGELANLPSTLRDLLNKFDEARTLFFPISWRNMLDAEVDEKDAKVLDFLKDDDTDEKKSRTGSPVGMESRLGRIFNTLF